MKRPQFRLPKSTVGRAALGLPLLALVITLFLWRGPSFTAIGDAFAAVEWQWVAVAIALNLVSVLARALAWTIVIRSAMTPPHPAPGLVFSAFSVGLFANAVLPGRIGELARVAVLTRKMPERKGAWATLVGTVFAHRVFDVVPVVLLVLYVVATANIPTYARSSLIAAICVGIALFAFAFISARRPHEVVVSEAPSKAARIIAMARQGLGVMRSPLGAASAILFQCLGWICQLFAVWTAMFAFDIKAPLPAAGVVLLLMNVVTIFPFWPGNVGLVQVAIATALAGYGVAYGRGIAYGFGLQAIEASVGIGVGLLFIAREGLSMAMLRVMPNAAQAEAGRGEDVEEVETDAGAESARVPG